MRGRAVATPDAVRRVQVNDESRTVPLDPAAFQDTQNWNIACQTVFGEEEIEQSANGLENQVANIIATIMI